MTAIGFVKKNTTTGSREERSRPKHRGEAKIPGREKVKTIKGKERSKDQKRGENGDEGSFNTFKSRMR